MPAVSSKSADRPLPSQVRRTPGPEVGVTRIPVDLRMELATVYGRLLRECGHRGTDEAGIVAGLLGGVARSGTWYRSYGWGRLRCSFIGAGGAGPILDGRFTGTDLAVVSAAWSAAERLPAARLAQRQDDLVRQGAIPRLHFTEMEPAAPGQIAGQVLEAWAARSLTLPLARQIQGRWLVAPRTIVAADRQRLASPGMDRTGQRWGEGRELVAVCPIDVET